MKFKVGEYVFLNDKINYWNNAFLKAFKNKRFKIIEVRKKEYKIETQYESGRWKKGRTNYTIENGVTSAYALPDKLFTMEI